MAVYRKEDFPRGKSFNRLKKLRTPCLHSSINKARKSPMSIIPPWENKKRKEQEGESGRGREESNVSNEDHAIFALCEVHNSMTNY